MKQILMIFTYIFFLLSMFKIHAYEDYGEIQTTGARSSMQAMRSFQVQWSNYLFYTMNVDTPGFIETGAFNSRFVEGENNSRIDVIPFYRWRAGPVIETNRPLDVYIEAASKGFFVIQLPRTIGYTRDGRFKRDSTNRLVSLAGDYPILGENGEIVVPLGSVSITEDGSIYVDGQFIDRLKIAVFPTYKEMQKLNSVNGTVFVLLEEAEILQGIEYYRLVQGHLEENNIVKALVGDITYATNGYKSNAKILKVLARSASTATQIANPSQ